MGEEGGGPEGGEKIGSRGGFLGGCIPIRDGGVFSGKERYMGDYL